MNAIGANPGATSAPPLSELTGYLLRRAFTVSTEHLRACIGDNANLRDVGILALLDAKGPMSQREVSDLLDINRTIMVKLVDALEGDGHLLRARNPSDRRQHALTVTASGHERLQDLVRELEHAAQVLTADLTGRERDRLNHLLQDLLKDTSAALALPMLDDNTGYLLWEAHRRTLARITDELRPLGVLPRDYGVLATVAAAQPCSQQHVADGLGVTPPAVMWLVEDLEKSGLLERPRNPDDRRSYDLTLTAEGERRLAHANEIVAAAQARVVARLGVRRDNELRHLLRTITGV